MIGYGGLPAFMMIATAFAVHPHRWQTPRAVVTTRLRRLIVPWLFWCVVYGLARPRSFHLTPSLLLIGPRLHLWFLPFAFAVTSALGVAALKSAYRPTPRALAGWAVASGLAVIAGAYGLACFDGIRPLAQWAFTLPSVVIGIAFAHAPAGSLRLGRPLWGLVALVVLVGVGGIVAELVGWPGLATPYLCGTLACAVAWCVPGKATPAVLRISGLALGIYVLHPLVAEVLVRAGAQLSPNAAAVATTAFSALVIGLLRRTPLRAFV